MQTDHYHRCYRYLGVASLGAWQKSAVRPKQNIPSESYTTVSRERDLQVDCGRMTGLVDDQLSVCRQNPNGLQYVVHGARLGLLECQYQFQNERWNCTPAGQHINQTVFEQVLQRG